MLKDKIVIVTGAAKGIGRGIAEAFTKEGAKVVTSDIDSQGVDIVCDVSKKTDVNNLINQTVEKFGGLDILVNNAGIFPFQSFLELTEADWDKVLDVNLKSIFLTSQAAAKVMKEGSKIVNISSIASFVGFEGLTHYCASKGGMNSFVRALALELAPKKINVNAVAPGSIDTPGSRNVSDEEETKELNKMIPWGRMGQPEDIANAVVFLASPGADYITGQTLIVDGGWTLR